MKNWYKHPAALEFFLQAELVFQLAFSFALTVYFFLIQISFILMVNGKIEPPPIPDFSMLYRTKLFSAGVCISHMDAMGASLRDTGKYLLDGLFDGMQGGRHHNANPFDINLGFNPFALLFRLLFFAITFGLFAFYAFALMPINLGQAMLLARIKEIVSEDKSRPHSPVKELSSMPSKDQSEFDFGIVVNVLAFAWLLFLVVAAGQRPIHNPYPQIAMFSGFCMCGLGLWLTHKAYTKAKKRSDDKADIKILVWYWIKLWLTVGTLVSALNFNIWVGLSTGLFFVMTAFLLSMSTEDAIKKEHLRGTFLSGTSFASGELMNEYLNQPKPQSGVLFGGTMLHPKYLTKHFLITGTTGSGKTITLMLMMASMLPQIKPGSGKRALLFDAKKELLPLLSGMGITAPIIPLNPFDQRSYAWDIAADITEPRHAEALADILVPPERGDGNRFFRDAVAVLMIGVITYFIRHADGKWTLRDVLLAMSSTERITKILSHDPITKEYLSVLGEEKTAANVRATLTAKTIPYNVIAACWHNAGNKKISLKEWLKGSSILVLGQDATSETAMATVNRIIFTRAAQLLLDKKETDAADSFIIIDELPLAGKLDNLERLCSVGRSKGVSVTLAFQDIGQIWEVYGKDKADAMLNQCNSNAYLRLAGEKTAKWVSDRIGTHEIRETRESSSWSDSSGKMTNSKSISTSDRMDQVVLPSELTSIPETNKVNGLRGLYDVGSKLFWNDISWDLISKHLPAHNDRVEGFIGRPREAQFPTLWDKADLHRLGLTWLDDAGSTSTFRTESYGRHDDDIDRILSMTGGEFDDDFFGDEIAETPAPSLSRPVVDRSVKPTAQPGHSWFSTISTPNQPIVVNEKPTVKRAKRHRKKSVSGPGSETGSVQVKRRRRKNSDGNL